MAGKLPAFLSGTDLIIDVGGVTVMECQALSFQETIQNQQSHALGDYSSISNDPVLLTGVGGTLSVLRYSSAALACANGSVFEDPITNTGKKVAARVTQGVNQLSSATRLGQDGNSLAFKTSFSPAQLLLESTFDIKVYTRSSTGASALDPKGRTLLYTISDCIMTGWSMSFSVGALATEQYSWIGRIITENTTKTGSMTVNA